MFSIFVALLTTIVFVSFMLYDNRKRTQWAELGSGILMQRRAYNHQAYFICRMPGLDSTSLVPALWEIKKPFSKNPTYITQHEDQLRAWWEPLAEQFASLGQDSKAVKYIRFAPSLGIYVQTNARKKTATVPEEYTVAELLKEATATWKPRRFEVDSSYPVRESLMANWYWAIAVAAAVGIHGMFAYSYVDFLGDLYYALLGTTMAIVAAGALAFWFYPKMEGSRHRLRTIGHIFVLGFICMSVTLSYALVGLNMISRKTVCEMSVPVTQWYSNSNKNKSYHAVLDLQGCNADIETRAEINVRRSDYQTGTTVNVRVSRGPLNRYVLEKK